MENVPLVRANKTLDFDNWTTQLRKGLLELCIVNVLAEGETYGYDLTRKITRIPGLVITEGTVYPLLSRLQKAGAVKSRLQESATGPARKYYSLSAEGVRIRERMNAHWDELGIGIDMLRKAR